MAAEWKIYRCERCSHQWPSRSAGGPRSCPNCRSPRWADPLPLHGRTKHDALQYSFHEISQGQSRFYKWYVLANGELDLRRNMNRHRAANIYAKRHGIRFEMDHRGSGVSITRLD